MRGKRAADHPGSRGNDLSTALRSRIYGRNAISTHLDFLKERSERKLAIRSGSIYGPFLCCGTPGVRKPLLRTVSSTLALRPGAAFAPRGRCATAAGATAGSSPRRFAPSLAHRQRVRHLGGWIPKRNYSRFTHGVLLLLKGFSTNSLSAGTPLLSNRPYTRFSYSSCHGWQTRFSRIYPETAASNLQLEMGHRPFCYRDCIVTAISQIV